MLCTKTLCSGENLLMVAQAMVLQIGWYIQGIGTTVRWWLVTVHCITMHWFVTVWTSVVQYTTGAVLSTRPCEGCFSPFRKLSHLPGREVSVSWLMAGVRWHQYIHHHHHRHQDHWCRHRHHHIYRHPFSVPRHPFPICWVGRCLFPDGWQDSDDTDPVNPHNGCHGTHDWDQ